MHRDINMIKSIPYNDKMLIVNSISEFTHLRSEQGSTSLQVLASLGIKDRIITKALGVAGSFLSSMRSGRDPVPSHLVNAFDQLALYALDLYSQMVNDLPSDSTEAGERKMLHEQNLRYLTRKAFRVFDPSEIGDLNI